MKRSHVVRLTTLLSLSGFMAAAMTMTAAAQGGGGGGGGGVSSFGDCSGDINTTWTLTAKPAGDRIKVQVEVFAYFTEEEWRWTLTDNGARVAKGRAIDNKEHQHRLYFRIDKTIADQAGPDVIEFKATGMDSGRLCDGSLTI